MRRVVGDRHWGFPKSSAVHPSHWTLDYYPRQLVVSDCARWVLLSMWLLLHTTCGLLRQKLLYLWYILLVRVPCSLRTPAGLWLLQTLWKSSHPRPQLWPWTPPHNLCRPSPRRSRPPCPPPSSRSPSSRRVVKRGEFNCPFTSPAPLSGPGAS